MAIFRLSDAGKNAMASALIAFIDADAAPATCLLYTGTMPASPADAVTTQTLLGTCTMSADPSATASAGLVTFNVISQDDAANASGTAAWVRVLRGDGSTVVADLDVGAAGSGATAIINTTTVVAGGPVKINSFTIQVG